MAKVFVQKRGWFRMLSLAQKAMLPKRKLKAYRRELAQIDKTYTGKWIDKKAYLKYKNYISKSDKWREKRELALDYYGNQCCDCGGKYNLQVHHRHYQSLYKEKMTDLLVLCKDCHNKIHPTRKSNG